MTLDAELEVLQYELALLDLTSRQVDALELLIVRLGPLKVKMYQEVGHRTPHLHIDYGHETHTASCSITENRRLAGTLHRKYDRAVTGWIATHQDKLLEAWRSLQDGSGVSSVLGELAGSA